MVSRGGREVTAGTILDPGNRKKTTTTTKTTTERIEYLVSVGRGFYEAWRNQPGKGVGRGFQRPIGMIRGDVSCLEEEGERVDGMARKESRDRWEKGKDDWGGQRKGGNYGEEEREREERKRESKERERKRERNPEAGEKKDRTSNSSTAGE